MLVYDWPGNVRELENCLERSYAFTTGPLIHSTICLAKLRTCQFRNRPMEMATAMDTRKSFPLLNLKSKRFSRTITELNGDKLQAARLLGIGKTTLYRKLKDYASQEA